MMTPVKQIGFLILAGSLMLAGCSEGAEEKKPADDAAAAPAAKTQPERVFDNNVGRFADEEGVVGIFPVGEMLCLSIIDSADMKDVSARVARNYTQLEEDMNAIGAEMDGPPGQISYNNDPANFKFECLLLIKKMPSVAPANSDIVVLEATKMLIYNHYGPYQDLHKSYDKIRKYCAKNQLVQSGPVREFYVTDPLEEKNQSRWLTRIMLPVTEKE